MAYTINLTNGNVIATVQNGTIDNTTTSLTLVGKNYAGYGEFVAENFVWMLENSSNATAPAVPLKGQLWYDSSASILKVYNGDAFKNLASAIAQDGAPTENIIGDMWFDTINSQLNVYDGNTFILIGPAFSSGTGTSGSIVDTMVDTIAVEHIVVKFFVNDAVVAIVSKDTAFTPRPEDVVPGFTTINPGIQLATTVGAAIPEFTGTATNSLSLGDVIAANYLRSDIDDATDGKLIVQDKLELRSSGFDAIINNPDAAGDILLQSNGTTVITVDGTTDKANVANPIPGSTEIANADYVDTLVGTAAGTVTSNAVLHDGTNDITGVINPATDANINFGEVAKRFNNVYAVTYNGNVVGNITGNVLGNLTGNSAGFHTGNVLGNVTGNLTGNADTASNSLSSFTVNGTLTVGTPSQNASYLYMSDADHGSRILHCNSDRIGFLTQAGGWGTWCDDAGNWETVGISTGYANLKVIPHAHGTGTRVMNATYTNTTGRTMFLGVQSRNHNNFRGALRCTVSGVAIDFMRYTGNADISPGGFWVIPVGGTYNVSITDTTADTYTQWIEYY